MLWVVVLLSLVAAVTGDTPADCQYPQIVGQWMFMIGTSGYDNTIKCANFDPKEETEASSLGVNLYFPDYAVDEYGNEGFWTLIYNQGFEVTIGDRKYFAFSYYEEFEEEDRTIVESYCDTTFPGWAHDTDGENWACYVAFKVGNTAGSATTRRTTPKKPILKKLHYSTNTLYSKMINAQQTSWKAGIYEKFDGVKMEDMVKMSGGRRSSMAGIPRPAEITDEQQQQASSLPESFDWRDVKGVNYVTRVHSQGFCGSCYTFSSLGMMEARWRIRTNNTVKPLFSRQDVLECSQYSQGCDGGFPYLISGKYAEDFGLVSEECSEYLPQVAKDRPCSTDPSCHRYYTTDYRYIGGFYGACNEALMRLSLVKRGPISVAFKVRSDFRSYKSGIYYHTGFSDPFNPFEETTHAVLVVGYGTDTRHPDRPVDYWIVQNSWGDEWGEHGYFRIRRGTDECGIESMAVEATPVL